MKNLTLLSFLSICVFANESEILTQTKQEIIDLKKEQIQQKKKTNQYDWVGDINLKASLSTNQDDIQSEDYSISISQDIFRFGGIGSKIKYAKELENLQNLELKKDTKSDLSTLYTLLIDIKQNELSLKQNILNTKNTKIDIAHKKSEYKAGQLSISELNNAIMKKNNLRDTYQTILLTKQKNINSLKEYTSKSYNIIKIPNISLLKEESFLKESLDLKYLFSNKEVLNLSYEIKKSDYLPVLSIDGKYGYSNTDEIKGDDYYNYGLNLTIPLRFTSSNDIQNTKLEYLINKQNVDKKKNELQLIYNETLLSINSNKQKIKLANEDIKLYEDLLFINIEEYKAGYKTIDDVQTLENSKLIRELDIKFYKLNIEKELLRLYFMI